MKTHIGPEELLCIVSLAGDHVIGQYCSGSPLNAKDQQIEKLLRRYWHYLEAEDKRSFRIDWLKSACSIADVNPRFKGDRDVQRQVIAKLEAFLKTLKD